MTGVQRKIGGAPVPCLWPGAAGVADSAVGRGGKDSRGISEAGRRALPDTGVGSGADTEMVPGSAAWLRALSREPHVVLLFWVVLDGAWPGPGPRVGGAAQTGGPAPHARVSRQQDIRDAAWRAPGGVTPGASEEGRGQRWGFGKGFCLSERNLTSNRGLEGPTQEVSCPAKSLCLKVTQFHSFIKVFPACEFL